MHFCMAFVILFGFGTVFLELIMLCCIFALLIKKDGGIRPNEVLATCANKVLHSISSNRKKISLRKNQSDFLVSFLKYQV